MVLLIGCSSPAAAREPVANHQPPPPPTSCPTIDDEDARAITNKTAHAIDLDGDPATAETVVEHGCGSGLSCTYQVYAQRTGCWTSLGATGELMDQPSCEPGAKKGTYCTLSGMRLMIHGDAQEYLYPFDGAYGDETPGSRYVEGPSKNP
jgi:hypothetical protein